MKDGLIVLAWICYIISKPFKYVLLFAFIFGTDNGLYIACFGYIVWQVINNRIIPHEWLQDAAIPTDDNLEKEFANDPNK